MAETHTTMSGVLMPLRWRLHSESKVRDVALAAISKSGISRKYTPQKFATGATLTPSPHF
jgi:hypothetical protein